MATEDRYQKTRAVSEQIMMEIHWGGEKKKKRSCLSEMLDIANGTGHRLSAICELRYQDLLLNRGLFGSIRWPKETDKEGFETTIRINEQVRSAFDQILAERPGEGPFPLFPKPTDPTKPVSRHLPDKWLREGEKLAGLDPLEGGLWHPYRRKWATERKHLPDVDVAAAGGWRNTVSLKTAYQQADSRTIFDVVTGARPLGGGVISIRHFLHTFLHTGYRWEVGEGKKHQ